MINIVEAVYPPKAYNDDKPIVIHILYLTFLIAYLFIFIQNSKTQLFILITCCSILALFNSFLFIETIFSIKNIKNQEYIEYKNDNINEDSTAIIFAYLPNEENIIKDSIIYFLTANLYSKGNLKIVLAYNTPFYIPIIEELDQLSDIYPNFELYYIKNSDKKSININSILQFITTPTVGFFDADSRPEAKSFDIAIHLLNTKYDFIQGSNLIINQNNSFINKIVRTEYKIKHYLSYKGRFRMLNFAYFAGSNGFWKTELIKNLKANTKAQVEDIDLSVRALLNNSKLGYEFAVKSFENAPKTIRSLISQRIRWAEGWTQLSINYYKHFLKATNETIPQKYLWIFFFTKRIIQPILFLFFSTLFLKLLCTSFQSLYEFIIIYFLYYVLIASITSFIFCKYYRGSRDYLIDFIIYSINYPLYDLLINFTIFIGSFIVFKKKPKWKCTPR